MKVYSVKDLLLELKKAREEYPDLNIGASRPSLYEYERKGIIKKPNSNWRFYTKEEIRDIVNKVIKYKQ